MTYLAAHFRFRIPELPFTMINHLAVILPKAYLKSR